MEAPRINIGNSKEEKIVTKELKIGQNVFIYNESVIPLCNISRISIVDEEEEAYDKKWVIVIIIGIVLTCTGVGAVIGLPFIVIAAWMLYRTYQHNQGLGEYLKLNLNSGQNVYLHSDDHNFTIEIMDIIINCINSNEGYKINMEKCKIKALQLGEGNYMTVGKG